MRPAPHAFFLPAESGQRLCVYHAPAAGAVSGAMVCVHPWAEEMNKSRRMLALQARALAAAGWAVLQIDLHGCGDSSGDFGEASWSGWIRDVGLAADWLQARHDAALWFWGLRAGCLLAVQAAAQRGADSRFLFWQPVVAGRAALQQFLRLKAAADLQQAEAKGGLRRLRDELSAGHRVEVAGYALSPALALGLEQAALQAPAQPARALWLELSTREDAALLPASADCVRDWRAAGHVVDCAVVPGPAFWQTQEIEDAPALITATLAALRKPVAP